MKYFGTDGIRGKAYQELTLDFSYQLGLALNEYQKEVGTTNPNYAYLKLVIDSYSSSKPCKITNIIDMVDKRHVSDNDTVASITNICKYSKLTSNQSIGEVQMNSSIKNAFINNGWTTSKTRAGMVEPGGEAIPLYYYNDNGYWVTMNILILM